MGLEPTFAGVVNNDPTPPNPTALCSQSLLTEASQPDLGLGSAPTALVRVPELTCASGTCVNVPGTAQTVRRPAFDRDDQQILPMQSLYYGLVTEDFTELSKSDSAPGPDYKAIFFDRIRQNWEDNDNAVGEPCEAPACTPFPRVAHGCYEYIYEKYYDWARYTDAIAPLGEDIRAAWNIAYDPNPTLTRSNIGFRGVNGTPLQRRDGVATDPQFQFPSGTRGKNTFLSKTYGFNDGSGQFYGYGVEDLYVSTTGQMRIKLKSEALAQEMATRVNSYPGHVEDWTYHQSMGNALLPQYLDTDFEYYAHFVKSFNELISRRAEVNATIVNLLVHNFADAVTLVNQQPILSELERTLAALSGVADPLLGRLVGAKAYQRQLQTRSGFVQGLDPTALNALFTVDVARFAFEVPQTGFTTYSNESDVGPSSGGLPLGGIGLVAPRGSGGLLSAASNPSLQLSSWALWGDLTTLTLDDIDQLFRALEIIDGQIETKLLEAKSIGCIVDGDLIGATPTPCDWSPRMFRDRMQDPYSSVREVDFGECRDRTVASDLTLERMNQLETLTFVHLPYPQAPAGQMQLCSPGSTRTPFASGPNLGNCIVELTPGDLCVEDFRSGGVASVERYLACYDKWVLDVQKGLEALLDQPLFNPETGEVEVGKQASDTFELGGELFGVEFDFTGAWGLQGASIPVPASDASYCGLDAGLNASVSVVGKAFYQSVDLVDAAVDVGVQGQDANQIYLEVLGKEVFGETINVNVDTIKKGGDQVNKTLFKYEQIIMVAWLPLSLEAGIRGFLGADGSGGGDTANCASGNLSVSGSLIPKAGVEGYAEASIDAAIVEAGVSGNLELISLRFPFTVGLDFAGSTQSVGSENLRKSNMTVSANLDILMTLLSGYFSAFVEVCFIFVCERAEATIFSWEGPRLSTPLFEFAFSVDLEPLALLQAQGPQTPGGN